MTNVTQTIQTIRRRILASAAEIVHYTNWDDEYSRKSVVEASSPSESFGNSHVPFILISELQVLSFDVLIDLGFFNFDDKLILIPLWLKNFIDPREEVTTLSGTVMKIADADDDNRYGAMAIGFFLSEEFPNND